MEKEISKKFLTNAPKCDILVSVNGKEQDMRDILQRSVSHFKATCRLAREVFHGFAWVCISLGLWSIIMLPFVALISVL